MNTRTKKEIINDWFRTVKIVTFTVLAVLLIGWLGFGTVAMMEVTELKNKVEYYERLEEEANNGKRLVIVDELTGEIIYAEKIDR